MAQTNGAKVVPLLEDSVECLFFSAHSSDGYDWDALCLQLNTCIQSLSTNYIWHRDEFRVHRPIEYASKEDIPEHLASITCFGDNIEDEWFIVYLVLEITKKFKNLIVQVRDDDGEFLLIEAADYLPSWANPDSTDNRVFIYQGQIHIIPPNLQRDAELKDALQMIANSSNKTVASNAIQQSILNRIGNYPEKMHNLFHRTVVKLPVDIAALITLKPALIAPLVNAFCNHDVLDAKACKSIEYNDCVIMGIKFTKCLYAMLMHAKPLKNINFKEMNDKKCVIGHKLTAGYQILMNKPNLDIFSSKQYKNFMSKLNASGYFKNNIEGSKDYNELLRNAKEFYSIMECPVNSQVANEISNMKLSIEFAQTREDLLQKKSTGEEFKLDDEDWLKIDPDQLNELLDSRYGKRTKFNDNDTLTANNVTSKLSSFLMKTSDFEGIETTKDDSTGNVELDPEDFVNSVQKMLDMITIGKEASDSDEDNSSSGDDMEQDDELEVVTQAGLQDNKTILKNIIQSMKEEGLSGPSSNLLKSVGVKKTDLLDSDDDDDE
ncbi:protein ecdysoneless homolog [Leguminivora glycinivorella]|uniref:protein ecdysoneless homolog n=1 Tax=Leguminivora glycinivorella TaxID=1035111 RepID=UPI00200E9533|nr:protein ecdysoneless homolog [Leguminivora glycinivorella]